MHDLMRKHYKLSAADTPNADSAGAVSEFVFPNPVMITMVGIMVTTAIECDAAVAFTATLSRRPTLGSATSAVSLGVFTMGAINESLTAGDVRYKVLAIADHDGETAEDGTTRNIAPNAQFAAALTDYTPYLILPGQSFAMTLDTNAEADSGVVLSFVEYIELPFTGAYIGEANVERDVTQD